MNFTFSKINLILFYNFLIIVNTNLRKLRLVTMFLYNSS